MELYNGTGVTTTGTKRATKSIGALAIGSSRAFGDLTTETIKVWVERANADNFVIADNVLLRDFIVLSTFGEKPINSASVWTGGLLAICELSVDGGIPLQTNESIQFEINNLEPTATYTVDGIEFPIDSEEFLEYEIKTMLSDEKRKVFKVADYDMFCMNAADKFRELHLTFSNGERISYSQRELHALSRDFNGIPISRDDTNEVAGFENTYIPFVLDEVDYMEIEKITGTMDIVFKSTIA